MSEQPTHEHRLLQQLADRVYRDAESEQTGWASAFSWVEKRQEAAFRVWLRNVDLTALPTSLPTESELNQLALVCDYEHGDDCWCAWPIWSSCQRCAEKEYCECSECRRLAAFLDR